MLHLGTEQRDDMNDQAITLTKVSSSLTRYNDTITIYESSNGLTITFTTSGSGEVHGDAYVRKTTPTNTPIK